MTNDIPATVAAAVAAGLDAGNRLQNDATREVDLLAGLFDVGVARLRDTLPPALASIGLSCRIHAVYCHQSPKVTTSVGTCELGDLLVAVRFSHGDRAANRALLTQLKVVNRGGPTRAQAALYERWPPFEYAAWPGGGRRVGRPAPHPGAQWGRITLCPTCEGAALEDCHHLVTLELEMPRHGFLRPFSDEVADLIVGGGGRPFGDRDQAERTIGWDRVVWDLLDRTGERLLNYARAKLANARRRRDIELVAEFGLMPSLQGVPELLRASRWRDESDLPLIGELVGGEGDPGEFDGQWDDRADGGISVLLVDVGFG